MEREYFHTHTHTPGKILPSDQDHEILGGILGVALKVVDHHKGLINGFVLVVSHSVEFARITLPETNMDPQDGTLKNYFPLQPSGFQGPWSHMSLGTVSHSVDFSEPTFQPPKVDVARVVVPAALLPARSASPDVLPEPRHIGHQHRIADADGQRGNSRDGREEVGVILQ